MLTAGSFRDTYHDVSGSLDFTAATDDTTLLTGKTGHTIFIQKIVVWIKTSVAQTLTFQDSAGTPIEVAVVSASPGANTRFEYDFGSRGKPLTEAKNFVANFSAVGLAGHFVYEAYMKQTAIEYLGTTTGRSYS